MNDKPQNQKTLGHVDVSVLEESPLWQAYRAAETYNQRSAAKTAVKGMLREELFPDLPADAVIDFIKYDDNSIMVFQDLAPKKVGRRKRIDLTELLRKKLKGDGGEDGNGGDGKPKKPRNKLDD